MMAAERRVADVADSRFGSQSPPPPPPMTAKRKIHAEDEPLPAPTNPPKRAKKTTVGRAGGRKLTIIPEPAQSSEAGPSSRPASSFAPLAPPSRQSSRAPSPNTSLPITVNSQPLPHRASSTQPPTMSTTTRKPLSASLVPPVRQSISAKGKERQTPVPPLPSVTRGSVPRDVFESQDIPPRGRSTSRQPPDFSLPLPLRETPLIEKNRELRSQASQRRRSSLEHQRRASENLGKNGGINVPHPDVSSSQYHRHISVDVPPVQRTRQLLVWSSSRTQSGSSGTQPGTPNGSKPPTPPPNLPVLSVDSSEALRSVQDTIIRMLAEGSIDTTPFSDKGKDKARDKSKKFRPNPMNEKNRLRIDAWKSYIARADAEEKIWLHIKTSANAQLAKLTQAHEAQPGARKVKKLTDEWFPQLLDAVDERWRDAARLAQSTTALDEQDTSQVIDAALQELLQDVELHVDEIQDMLNSTNEITHRAESLLDKFFATVSATLASRATYGSSRGGSSSAPRQPDTMNLIRLLSTPREQLHLQDENTQIDHTMAALRALSRVTRPSSVNGPAALAAAREIGVERKMTAVPPRTPGKERAKTPRRGSTPGRNRGR